jgi:hypothetical protein
VEFGKNSFAPIEMSDGIAVKGMTLAKMSAVAISPYNKEESHEI